MKLSDIQEASIIVCLNATERANCIDILRASGCKIIGGEFSFRIGENICIRPEIKQYQTIAKESGTNSRYPQIPASQFIASNS